MTRNEEIQQKADHLHTPGYAHNKIFVEAAHWADETMIKRACDWLTLNVGMLLKVLDVEYNTNETDVRDFIEDFRKAMEK